MNGNYLSESIVKILLIMIMIHFSINILNTFSINGTIVSDDSHLCDVAVESIPEMSFYSLVTSDLIEVRHISDTVAGNKL